MTRTMHGPTRETDQAFLDDLAWMLETGESMGTAAMRYGIKLGALERRVSKAKQRLNGGVKQSVRRVA